MSVAVLFCIIQLLFMDKEFTKVEEFGNEIFHNTQRFVLKIVVNESLEIKLNI